MPRVRLYTQVIYRFRVSSPGVYKFMFYLTIVNKILPHFHSWLARQYQTIGWPYIQKDNTFERTLVNSVSSSSVKLNNCLGAQNRFIERFFSDYPQHMLWLRNKKTI